MRSRTRAIAICAAVVASAATSRPRWRLEVPIPRDAVPKGKAKQLVVEASGQPFVMCGSRQAQSRENGTSYTFLCAANQSFGDEVLLSGHAQGAGLCSGPPKPPSNAFLRVVKIEVVDAWNLTVTHEVPFTRSQYDANLGEARFAIDPQPDAVSIELSGEGLTELKWEYNTDYFVTGKYADISRPLPAMVTVKATITGVGEIPAHVEIVPK